MVDTHPVDATKAAQFEKMYETVLSLVDDENLKAEVSQLLKNGYLDDYIPRNNYGKDDMLIEFARRLDFAMLMIANKDTFDYIKNNDIVCFHGTNANALPGIRNEGLKSLTSIINSGSAPLTGEEWSRFSGRRDYISFTDVLSISSAYSEMNPKTNNPDVETFNFPIIFGITRDCMLESRPGNIDSTLPEVGTFNDIPLDKISIAMVPSDKVEFVKKILGDTITVMPNDIKYGDYFYDMDGNFYPDALENFKKSLNHKSKNIDALGITKKTKLSNVKEAIKLFGELFGKEFSYDESRPNSR